MWSDECCIGKRFGFRWTVVDVSTDKVDGSRCFGSVTGHVVVPAKIIVVPNPSRPMDRLKSLLGTGISVPNAKKLIGPRPML